MATRSLIESVKNHFYETLSMSDNISDTVDCHDVIDKMEAGKGSGLRQTGGERL